MKHDGDDLEDDFVIDDLVALSGGEDSVLDGEFFSDVWDENNNEPPTGNEQTFGGEKRKKREKAKERRIKKRKLVESVDSEDHSITEQLPDQLADYLSLMQEKSFPKMSKIELDDMRIPGASITDTTKWTGPRTLDQLVDFIVQVLPTLHTRLSQKSKSNGAPTLLFVAGAALRVADVTRVLKDKRLRGEKGGEVAKLFAKHFKLAEHVAYLRRTKVGAAVGTPGRIGQLLSEAGVLTISALSHIVLDVTFRDAKKRNLFDIPETRDEILGTVLGCPQILNAIREGKVEVVLF